MRQNRQYISIWLSVLAFLIIAIVLLGGYTRLTGAGLSIVEWAPVSGVIPPVNQDAWELEFNKYKMFPEYKILNSTLSIKEFKFIFMVEFLHRILGRIIGLAMIVPFIYFYYKRYILKQDLPKYLIIFVMIGLQGVIGWYMVKSGLAKDPYVSHYRLSIHLITAIALYSFIIWQIISSSNFGDTSLKLKLSSLLGIIYLQTFFGAMVAGLKAGLVYNTFPLMGATFIPYELDISDLNNAVTVQFIHRILAYIVFVLSIYFSYDIYKKDQNKGRGIAFAILTACLLQLLLGVLTLLYSVPIFLGLAHQFGAILLITSVIYAIKKV
jgi:cytochrome c oxidase assembly protein subunit 15